jgi:predicted ATPase
MLDRFWVTNFKSLVNVEFRPAGVNLLVGANNAGKTNLCHALRFLALTARMPLDDAAKHCTAEPWNLPNVYSGEDVIELQVDCTLESEGEQLRFAYGLRLVGQRNSPSKLVTQPFSVWTETLRVTGGPFIDKILLQNTAGDVELLHEGTGSIVHTTAPTAATMLCRLYDLQTNRRSNLFKRYLCSWGYYSLDPIELRSNVATAMDRVLEPTGANLCSVLYTLHSERPRDERKLVEAARLVEPRLDLVSFQAPDPEHVYMFFEDKHSHRFGVQNISDGSLRYLALCFLILANRQESTLLPGPPLVMIEEPENGIYVGHLKPLFEKIDFSGTQGQFVFTSHSPYFIDLFDGTLEGLQVVRMGPRHSTVQRPDRAKMQELLGKFSLGEMHFRGLLE